MVIRKTRDELDAEMEQMDRADTRGAVDTAGTVDTRSPVETGGTVETEGVARAGERPEGGEPLLSPLIRGAEVVREFDLDAATERCLADAERVLGGPDE